MENENPILDTRIYEIRLPDGSEIEMTANKIIENIHSQVDEHGHYGTFFDSVIDIRKDESVVKKEDGYIITNQGRKKRRITTKGWQACILWKEGSDTWVPLSEIKESNPVEVAEFAINRNIHHEPAFAWWVPYVIRKRTRLINKVRSD